MKKDIKNNLNKDKLIEINSDIKEISRKEDNREDNSSTALSNFKSNGGIITDNEYEVTSEIDNNYINKIK